MSLLGLLSVLGFGAEETIHHNRQIEGAFQTAAKFVVSFQGKYGRLPNNEEFEIWAKRFPTTPYSSPHGMMILDSSFPDEAIKQFGKAPQDAFLLVYWRSEWNEYYASWVNRTTLQFDESKYYAFGSKLAESSILIIIALSALIGGHKIWPLRQRQEKFLPPVLF
ncbi:MAG: hypothetical protein OEV28_02035 [Nitrospirota bacterium]|nr:hypothetical protein [Nitrospirota bacterium]